jgi:hypothetical protein
MKKEKHPLYAAVLTLFILLLVLGAVLLIWAVSVGNSPFYLAPARRV